MNLTEQQVRSVADLAHLELESEELERLRQDLAGILSHVEKLNELDTDGVEPMAQVLAEAPASATLRADIVVPPLSQALALANSPVSGAGHFKVPRVIER